MRILLFFILIILISCSKLKKEQEQEIQLVSFESKSVEVVIEEQTIEIVENIVIEEEKEPVKITPKVVEKKVQQPKPQKKEIVETFVFNDNYYPLTKEDAKNFAFECYKKAKNMSNSDSAKIVIKKGLATFENASLYYLSAKQNYSDGNFSTATNLCKTAISRNDFWENKRNETIKLLVDCLEKTYEKTPSDFLMSQINNYKEMLK